MHFKDFIVFDNFDCKKELEFERAKEELSYVVDCSSGTRDVETYLNYLYSNQRPFNVILLNSSKNLNVEYLCSIYSSLTVLSFIKKKTKSELINLALGFLRTRYFLFVTENFQILSLDFDNVKKIFNSYKRPAVICPLFTNFKRESYPSIRLPFLENNQLNFTELEPSCRLEETFYPLAYIGIYDADVLSTVLDFEESIKDEYYSLLDFSARLYALGYSIMMFADFTINCSSFSLLKEKIANNIYCQTFNFRIFFLYKKRRLIKKRSFLNFIFRRMHISKKVLSAFYLLDIKSIVSRWRVEDVKEVL